MTEQEAAYREATAEREALEAHLRDARARLATIAPDIMGASGKQLTSLIAERVTLEAALEVLPGRIATAARVEAESHLRALAARQRAIQEEATALNEQLAALQTVQQHHITRIEQEDIRRSRREQSREQAQQAKQPVWEALHATEAELAPISKQLSDLELELKVNARRARLAYGDKIQLAQPGSWREALKRVEADKLVEARKEASAPAPVAA